MPGLAAINPSKTLNNLFQQYTSWDQDGLDQHDIFNGWNDTETLLKKPAGTKRDARLMRLSDAAEKERECFGDPHLSPWDAAREYFAEYADVLPECLRRWDKLLDRKAWRNRGTYESRWDQLLDPFFYSLELDDFRMSDEFRVQLDAAKAERPDLDLNDPVQIRLNSGLLKALVLDNLDHGACWIKLEGNTTRVHIHVVAERLAIRPDLKRSEVKQPGKVTPVYDRQGLIAYLLKPTFTVKNYDPDDLAKVTEAIQKLTLSIAARRITGKRRVMFQFYSAKNPIPLTQYSEIENVPLPTPRPTTARPCKPKKFRNRAVPSTARAATDRIDSEGTRSDPVSPHLRL